MRESEKRYYEDTQLVQDFLKKVSTELKRDVTTGFDSNGNYTITIMTDSGPKTHKQHRSPDSYHRIGD